MVYLTQLEKLKLKLGITDNSQDGLLELYLEDTADFILNQTHLDTIPQGLLSTQVELAIIYYNKQGIEGQTAHSEGGISRTFEDIPERIKKKIFSCRRLPRQVSL